MLKTSIPVLFKISSVMVLAFIFACETAPAEAETTATEKVEEKARTEFLIPVESFTDSSGTFHYAKNLEDNSFLGATAENQWLDYNLDIEVAGRYKVEVEAFTTEEAGTIWIEDYVGNKDDRTYNITGDITVGNTEVNQMARPQTFSKDGSPLDIGNHPIRLHFKNPNVFVKSIKFSLLKEHQVTPEILTQNTSGENLKLVWSDEFDGEGLPDANKWTYDIGDWGWGNNELQYYTEERLENARLEDGNLIIEARKNDDGHQWTSARLTTRGKVSFVHGRIEFRAKVPANKGNWAAGWTLGDVYKDEKSWPYCGEIDILESVGYEMNNETGDGKAHASVHCGAYYFKLGNQPTANTPVKNMEKEYHVYAVDWTENSIKAYVDDQLYFTYDDTSTELTWPFSKPQNIILNLAMGGGWGGAQGMDETVTSQQFILDYVRVYAFEK